MCFFVIRRRKSTQNGVNYRDMKHFNLSKKYLKNRYYIDNVDCVWYNIFCKLFSSGKVLL